MSKRKLVPAVLGAGFALILAMAFAADADNDKSKADAGKKHDIDYADDKADDQPEPPIKRDAPSAPDSAAGILVLSRGDRVQGLVHLTRDADLKIYDTGKKKLVSVRLEELTHIEQKVMEEHMEKEWRWLENANDQKVYTGKEYPTRELETVLHFKDGRTLTGPVEALLFVANGNGEQRFTLHKRQKGDPGTKLADLVYVTLVDFRPQEKPKKDEAK